MWITKKIAGILFLVASVAFVVPALAQDWQAVRLRGAVFALDSGAWVQLERFDWVRDDRVIRTAPNGRVTFARGEETVSLGPDTQVQIHDKGRDQFTIIQEYFGEVTVDVDKRNVQHFAVQTPMLVAVVKGTKFTVHAGAMQDEVTVLRGQVEVRDRTSERRAAVNRGGRAVVSPEVPLAVGDGQGELLVPALGEGEAGVGDDIATPEPPADDNQVDPGDDGDTGDTGDDGDADDDGDTGDDGDDGDAEKDADKAEKDAEKNADKAEKDAEKAEKDAEKNK